MLPGESVPGRSRRSLSLGESRTDRLFVSRLRPLRDPRARGERFLDVITEKSERARRRLIYAVEFFWLTALVFGAFLSADFLVFNGWHAPFDCFLFDMVSGSLLGILCGIVLLLHIERKYFR